MKEDVLYTRTWEIIPIDSKHSKSLLGQFWGFSTNPMGMWKKNMLVLILLTSTMCHIKLVIANVFGSQKFSSIHFYNGIKA